MPDESPTETKLFYGIQYWVSVDPKRSQFSVVIGQGINAIEQLVDCLSVDPGDVKTLFQKGHEYAQRIIVHEGADILADKFGLEDDLF